MTSKTVLLILILYLFSVVISEKVLISTGTIKNQDDDVFVATHEWQIIKEGQKIPKGLHVRINLATGLKEAKLLEPSAPNDKYELSRIEQPKSDSYSLDEAKEALKNIGPNEPSEDARIKEKFKSYDELKSDLDDLHISVKSDVDILLELLQNYDTIVANNSLDSKSKTSVILRLLDDLEYLIHQIDNANEFTKQHGFTRIIYNHFNDTNVQIKCQVLKIFGGTVQNNAKAQISALETGALEKLVKLVALEGGEVQVYGVYALGSLLRNFPLAQYYFVTNGGLNMLTSVFEHAANRRIRAKIITLLYDLLLERFDETTDPNDPNYQLKLEQYERTDFEAKLAELEWCTTIVHELRSAYNELGTDYDRIEQALSIVSLLFGQCARSFNASRLQDALQLYQQRLAAVSSQDSYYKQLQPLVKTILDKIQLYTHEL